MFNVLTTNPLVSLYENIFQDYIGTIVMFFLCFFFKISVDFPRYETKGINKPEESKRLVDLIKDIKVTFVAYGA